MFTSQYTLNVAWIYENNKAAEFTKWFNASKPQKDICFMSTRSHSPNFVQWTSQAV